MIRATTPTIEFIFPDEMYENSKEILITFKQGDKIIFNKSKSDLIDRTSQTINQYDIHLTQKETKMFDASHSLKIQVRFLTKDGEAYASNEKILTVQDVLNDEELM